jgi:iron complex outermembrane recepter protein
MSNNTRMKSAVSAALLGTGLVLAPFSAMAQLEEVVVTAQKRTESLQDAPLAVTAFSSDTLEALGAYDVTDVAEYTPNVSFVPTMGSTANIRMDIRGMSTAEPSLTVDPKVGVYLDGAYIARNSGAVFDIVDLERIEIMRGPQGTLWGKNTTGGAVNLITARPNGEFGFKQQLSAGNDGYFRSVSTLDTARFGSVAGRLTYMHKQTDGWATNVGAGEKDLASSDVDAFRIAIAWDVTDSFTVDYAYDQTDHDGVPAPLQITAVTPDAADLIGTYFIDTEEFLGGFNPLGELAKTAEKNDRLEKFNLDAITEEEVEISGHNLTMTWDVGNVTLKSISSYRDYESVFDGNDLDGGSWGIEENGMFRSIPIFHTTGFKEQDQFQQELQAVGDAFDGKLEYAVGLYYFQEDGEEVNPWDAGIYQPGTPVMLKGIVLGSWYTIDNESRAAYGQFTYRPTDDWYLTLGLRYTEDEKELGLLASDPRLDQAKSYDEDWSEFTPAFTVGYQPGDDMNLYFKYAEGFNAGVYANPTDPTVENIDPADPEELTSYEIGMKSQWLDNTLRFNAAIFYTDAENLQVTAFADGNRVIINSGEATQEGLELEATWLPTDNWTIDVNYGYQKDDRDDAVGSQNDDGKHSGRVGVGYSLPTGDWGFFDARVDASYKDEYYFSSNDSTVMKDRWLLGARAGFSEIELWGGYLRASLWGKNLTDEEYIEHGQDLGLDGGYGFAGGVFGQPRSYGIDVIWEM